MLLALVITGVLLLAWAAQRFVEPPFAGYLKRHLKASFAAIREATWPARPAAASPRPAAEAPQPETAPPRPAPAATHPEAVGLPYGDLWPHPGAQPSAVPKSSWPPSDPGEWSTPPGDDAHRMS
ncbi:hypothetical protein ACQP2F_38780 [Actinoplanes sp. CA-030573]|uniref:hypothetical protein n=1 Tax=Actinoplanes sp. CA-030573 TaxID=3239898 RepID=UPI003D8EAA0F